MGIRVVTRVYYDAVTKPHFAELKSDLEDEFEAIEHSAELQVFLLDRMDEAEDRDENFSGEDMRVDS